MGMWQNGLSLLHPHWLGISALIAGRCCAPFIYRLVTPAALSSLPVLLVSRGGCGLA